MTCCGAAANGVIDLAHERFTKNLLTERVSAGRPQLVTVRDKTEARYIVEQVLSNREVGTTLNQPAVLFRVCPRERRECNSVCAPPSKYS